VERKLKDTIDFGRQRKIEEPSWRPPWPAAIGMVAGLRTAMIGGVKLHLAGHLFFSLGMNAVNSDEGDTVIERRGRMFR
jgi:hypothetical protein